MPHPRSVLAESERCVMAGNGDLNGMAHRIDHPARAVETGSATAAGGARGDHASGGNAGKGRRGCASRCCRDRGRGARSPEPHGWYDDCVRPRPRSATAAPLARDRAGVNPVPSCPDRRASVLVPRPTNARRPDTAPPSRAGGHIPHIALSLAGTGPGGRARASRSDKASGARDGSA